MLKLYKRTGDSSLYWEAWEADKRTVVVHWGTLGTTGDHKEVKIPKGKSAEQVIADESAEPRANGYAELDEEELAQIILQYETQDDWGDEEDLDKRHEVEDLLNNCLGWTGNGHCDGGDIGSGTINTYCFVVDPHLAVKTIVEVLKENNLLEGAVIALDHEHDCEVLWPEDYEGEFSVL